MIISHNDSAVFATNHLSNTENNLKQNMEALSSGQRVNHASTDASGLAVSERMRSQIRGLNKASENIENGISFINVSESYLNETTDILQRIRELAVQSSNGIYSEDDRMSIQVEVSQLVSEVDRIASQAQFNGIQLLTGKFSKTGNETIKFQIGANTNQTISVNIGTMTSEALGLKFSQTEGEKQIISVADEDTSNLAISTIDEALKKVNSQRADLGAYQSRMEMADKGIKVASENLQASESRIRDTDMSTEMVDYTKNLILQHAGTAMLSQSLNINRDAVLSLLA